MSDTKEQLKAYFEQLRKSFAFCLTETWRLCPDNLPTPDRIQLDMADFMQNGPKRRGIRGFRGLSKTWLACAYLLWRFLRDVDERALFTSQNRSHAVGSLHMVRDWIDFIPFYRHLAPNPQSTQRDKSDMLDMGPSSANRVASITAIGITGQLPGIRASIIVPDDVETNENTLTHEQRARLLVRMDEHENIVFPDGDIIYLGTPHHEDTIYDELVDRGYTFRTYPIVYPRPDEMVPGLAPILQEDLDTGRAQPGDPIWPERFDRDFCVAKQAAIATHTWAMQFMLRSNLAESERYPLKLADFIVYPTHRDKAPASIAWGQGDHTGSTAITDIASVGFGTDQFYAPIMTDPTWMLYHGTKAYIDPAGLGKDEMAWAICGQLHGNLYIKYVDGVHGGATHENLEKIVLSLRDHGATELVIETNFGGDMLIRLIDPVIRRFMVRREDANPRFPNGWACSVIGTHSTGQKELRIINELEPPLKQHRIIIDPSVARDTILMKQATRLTKERNCLEHDDRIEALAGVVGLFKDLLDQDDAFLSQRREDREREDLARQYMGYRMRKPACWIKH